MRKMYLLIILILAMSLCFYSNVGAEALKMTHSKDGFQWHKGKIQDIERISLNPATSISLYDNKKTYFIYPPQSINGTLNKTLYLTALYESILISDEVTIKNKRHGVHREVVDIKLFKKMGNRSDNFKARKDGGKNL